MANHEQPYDPYIPSGRGTPGPNAQHDGNDRTAALQAQINDTVNVMRQNIQRTEERGGHIDHIVDKTDEMQKNASLFQRGTNRARKHLMWKNVRMSVYITLVIAAIIIIIILSVHFGKK